MRNYKELSENQQDQIEALERRVKVLESDLETTEDECDDSKGFVCALNTDTVREILAYASVSHSRLTLDDIIACVCVCVCMCYICMYV